MTNQNYDDLRLKQLVTNWIHGTNTFEDVQYLEEGVKEKLKELTNSIMRKFYSIVLQTKLHPLNKVNDTNNVEENLKNKLLSSLYRTYIITRYELGRLSKKDKDKKIDVALEWLSKITEYGIAELEKIANNKDKKATINAFENFTGIMEAIVAFHKLYGPKKQQ